MLTINIIGAGRLGKTIAKLISNAQAGLIQAICNQTLESSIAASKYIGCGEPYTRISDLPPADITFITTPDNKIKTAAQDLARSNGLKRQSMVVHCSGSLTSSELESLKSKSCYLASIHPMRSFADPDLSITGFDNTYCAIEGDEKATKVIGDIFEKINAIVYSIFKDKKSTYHAAGVIASNYLVTLCKQAVNCLENSGVEKKMAMHIIISLIQGTLDNLSSTLSAEKSLTGPIKRGDCETISKHMKAFNSNKELLEFYRLMGLLTIKIAGHDKNLEKLLEDNLQIEAFEKNKN